MLDGLAARLAAERGSERAKSEGQVYLDAGRAAVESGSLHDQIEADMRFHGFIDELSGNSLIGETTAPHWPYLRRVMGEVLRDDAQMPQTILGGTCRYPRRHHCGQRCGSGVAQPQSYFEGGKNLCAAAAGTKGGVRGRDAAASYSAHSVICSSPAVAIEQRRFLQQRYRPTGLACAN